MTNKIVIGSLSMDLKRVAIGYYNGSEKTAKRFSKEALKRKEEVEVKTVKPYIKELLVSLPKILRQKDNQKIAEDSLMYSTLLQNYATHNS